MAGRWWIWTRSIFFCNATSGWDTALLRMQGRSQSVQLLLQVRNSTVCFLLSLSAWLRYDTLASCLGASFARLIRLLRILIAPDLQAPTGLTSARSLRIILVETVRGRKSV